jgi:hypothetical protein
VGSWRFMGALKPMRQIKLIAAAAVFLVVGVVVTACGPRQDGDPNTNAKLTAQRQAVIARHKGRL